MRLVEHIMGMPITIDIPKVVDEAQFNSSFKRLRWIDDRFSTYKAGSEVSRFAARKLSEKELSDELKKVIKDCRKAQTMTAGYFSAWATGQFDPSGYVKGWAIAQAGQAIEAQGFKTYCVSAGGDIQARSDSEKIWNIGIQDPTDLTKILNKLSILNGAVATSGIYERGAHIINPKTKKPANELLSVTVTGPDIIWADVLATAVFAMGADGLEFMDKQPDYKALIIDKTGRQLETSGWPSYNPGNSR